MGFLSRFFTRTPPPPVKLRWPVTPPDSIGIHRSPENIERDQKERAERAKPGHREMNGSW
jgi:hypothetical protein